MVLEDDEETHCHSPDLQESEFCPWPNGINRIRPVIATVSATVVIAVCFALVSVEARQGWKILIMGWKQMKNPGRKGTFLGKINLNLFIKNCIRKQWKNKAFQTEFSIRICVIILKIMKMVSKVNSNQHFFFSLLHFLSQAKHMLEIC